MLRPAHLWEICSRTCHLPPPLEFLIGKLCLNCDSIKLETIIYQWRKIAGEMFNSLVAFNYMQHCLNRVINLIRKVSLTLLGGKKGCSCHIRKTFPSLPEQLFQFSSPSFIESQKNLFTFHWFFVRHHTRACNNSAVCFSGLRNTHVIRFNWIFIPNILFEFHPNHPALKHMSSRERKKLFLVRILVRWRNFRNDLWDLPQLIIKVFVKLFEVRSIWKGKKTSNFPNDYLLNF